MRQNRNVYKYIAVYVNDLAIAAKDPENISEILMKKYKFKLKGTGAISYHLGCDFFRDNNGILCFTPKKYIKKMISTYVSLFEKKPKQNITSLLEKGDHSELDSSDLLDEKGVQIYQSLIGAL